MRQPTDKCLLCNVNESTKKNSHILPRFISTNFLGPKTGKRQGFSLDSQKPVSINKEGEVMSRPQRIQDSPKEDYILCDECEAYFSILETGSAPLYNEWSTKVMKGEFKITKLHDQFSIVECLTASASLNRLFVYSMYWRTCISSHSLFSNYRLREVLEESLRSILLDYRTTTKAELIVKIEQKPIIIYPYCVMTAESFEDETANVLAALNPGNPASLHVDRFGFLLFESGVNLQDQITFDFSNKNDTDLKLMVLSEQLWYDVLIRRPIEMYAAQVKKNN